MGVCKPHPEIFRYALNRLHAVPWETAMVGDNLRADIAGAKELNLLSVWKPATTRKAGKKRAAGEVVSEPDGVIERLGQLLELF